MDLKQARSAASKMGMEIKVKELNTKDMEALQIMEAIEDRLFLQIEAGIPGLRSVGDGT